jgi:hypothetical protein
MPASSRPATRSSDRPADTGTGARAGAFATCVAAWLVPGAGHALQGQLQKALVLFVTLVAMFAIGIGFGGRVLPFQTVEPLVLLAAVAQWALGLPRIVAGLGGFGAGDVISITYEYGNTFLIVAGLLNALVVLDAFDLATGRKGR